MKHLVVSVHDAAPPYLENLKRISEWLDRNSIRPRCIKVVPNYKARWNILDFQGFMEWLQEEKEKGSEMIQHGYTHTGRENSGSLSFRLRSKCFTHQNAEFMGANYTEARAAIEAGQNILKNGNIFCSGFTSPTWYQSKETKKALQDCGFLYYTSYSWVMDGRKDQRVLSSAMA